MQTMIVGRFLAGFSGSAFLAVSGGTVVDLWPREQLQFPMVMYAASTFLGPVLGPPIGGLISSFTTWYVLLS
jgi:MFS family permease